jgi:release factor glutamine methyltransferase
MEKFSYKGLTIHLHPEVYEPSEDTFLMLDTVNVKQKDKVLEIGTGCGVIALFCAQKGADVICSDINPHAVELTKKNYDVNREMIKGSFKVRKGDLFTVVEKDEKFDVIIFNPPYLPTTQDELVGGSGWFDVATNGGVDGLSITKRFIDNVKKFLCEKGRAYIVFTSLSDRDKLKKLFDINHLKGNAVVSKSFDDEIIEIYCVTF